MLACSVVKPTNTSLQGSMPVVLRFGIGPWARSHTSPTRLDLTKPSTGDVYDQNIQGKYFLCPRRTTVIRMIPRTAPVLFVLTFALLVMTLALKRSEASSPATAAQQAETTSQWEYQTMVAKSP